MTTIDSSAADVVIARIVQYLSAIEGLEDHVSSDEEKIGKAEDGVWCWIQPGDEDIESQSLNGKKTRALLVYFDLMYAARFEATRAAGAIAARIENRIDRDPTLSRAVGLASLQGIARARADGEPIARLRMTYRVTFWTAAGAAETPI